MSRFDLKSLVITFNCIVLFAGIVVQTIQLSDQFHIFFSVKWLPAILVVAAANAFLDDQPSI